MHKKMRLMWVARIVLTTLIGSAMVAQAAERLPPFEEISGELPDKTKYLIRKPAKWNGTVISDLDFRTRADHGIYRYLLSEGFGLSGTARRDDRYVNLSQRGDVERIQQVLEIFKTKFGKPKRVIAFGRSAGGGAALSAAENFPHTTDGAIAMCATTPFLSANHRFDFLFLLKAVLKPHDSTVVVHPFPSDRTAVVARWQEVVEAALRTPEGKAKIAFAFAAAQFPYFGHTNVKAGTAPPPEANDPQQVLSAMLDSVVPSLEPTISNLNQLNTNPAPMTWNVGADYARYFDNADPVQKKLVLDLYREAGLDLQKELDDIDRMPRVSMDAAGAAVWLNDPVQTPRGNPKIPLFHLHTDGDQAIAQEQAQVYFDQARRNGKAHLVRSATVHRGGHCNFTTAEEATAVKVMMQRLDSGQYGDTSPAALTALAAGLATEKANRGSAESSYAARTSNEISNFVPRQLRPFNGEWRLRTYSHEFVSVEAASARR